MIMASILTYVLGCIWYLICLSIYQDRIKMGYPEGETFFTTYKIYKKTPIKRLVLSCYYVLTGLTTVGYGDFNAQNQNEKIFWYHGYVFRCDNIFLCFMRIQRSD